MPADFEDRAATWDEDPDATRRAQAVADSLRSAVPLTPATRLLEYGAGTGLLSQAIAGDVGRVTLADPSPAMRSVMEGKIAAGTLPSDARVWDLDLARDEAPDDRFDLVVTVMALHHAPDVPPVLDGFAQLLADGGHLGIVDLDEEDGSFHAYRPGFDGHDGFSEETLSGWLRTAGFRDVRFQPCFEVEREGRTYPLFLATCSVGGS